jgi:hypothetical protein
MTITTHHHQHVCRVVCVRRVPPGNDVVGPDIEVKLVQLGLDGSEPGIDHGPVLLVHFGLVDNALGTER